jgi:hypothetical protein
MKEKDEKEEKEERGGEREGNRRRGGRMEAKEVMRQLAPEVGEKGIERKKG